MAMDFRISSGYTLQLGVLFPKQILTVFQVLLVIGQAFASPVWMPQFLSGGQGRNIRHLPCISKRTGEQGVCMFAYTCMKSNGTHLGTCIDRFYFGSCCKLTNGENDLLLENPINFPVINNNQVLSPLIPDDSKIHSTQTTSPLSVTSSNKYSTNNIESSNISNGSNWSTTPKLETTTRLSSYTSSSSEKTVVGSGAASPTQAYLTQSSTEKIYIPIASVKPNKTESASPSSGVVTTHGSSSSNSSDVKKPATLSSISSVTATTQSYLLSTFQVVHNEDVSTTNKVSSTPHPKTTTLRTSSPSVLTTWVPIKYDPNVTTKKNVTVSTTPKPSTTTTTKKPSKPVKPTTTTRKPPPKKPTAKPTIKPTTQQSPKPAVPTKKPVQTSNTTTTKPTTTNKPTVPVKKPLQPTKKPIPSTSKPPTPKPAITAKPIPSTSSSIKPSQPPKPSTTQKPITATKPISTTRKPLPTTTPEGAVNKPGLMSSTQLSSNIGITTFRPEITSTTTKPGLITGPSLTTFNYVSEAEKATTPRPSQTTISNEVSSFGSIATIPEAQEENTNVIYEQIGSSNNKTTSFKPTTSKPSSTTVPFFPEATKPGLTKPPWIQIVQSTSTESTVSTTIKTTSTTTPATVSSTILSGLNTSDYTQVCGRRLFPESRVVGGEKSTFGKWPWQISLRQWRTSTYLHKCGAALLNENWAITAAHCVENVPPSDLLLRLGEHDLSTEDEPYGFQERRVQIVASHPQFDPRTFEYDLALLRFYEPVKFQPNIIPICVPEDDTNFVGRTAYVTGWGRLYEDGPLPSVLQEVSVPVINNTLCESMYRSAGYIEHIPEIFICAGWKKGGFDSCEGDSGGPMVIQRPDKRWLLAGVISWGIGCAEPNQPGVYTRISEFREWIHQILQF